MATRFHTPTPHWTHLLWFLDRTRWWWFAGIVLLNAVGFNGQWRITPDSALHIEAARVMIDGGEPAVDPRKLETIQPGLSGVLAAAGGVTGNDAAGGFGWAGSLVMLGFAAMVLAMTYRLLILHADRPTAVLVVILLGSNHLFYEMSFNLLTELPFTAGLVLLLWGHERRLKRKTGLPWSLAMMAAGVLMMAAFRSVAAVVVAGYLLAEVIRVVGRRDQRRLGFVLLGIGATGAAALWLGSTAVRDDAFLFMNTLRQLTAGRLLTNAKELYDAVLPEAILGVAVPPPLSWVVSAGVAAAGLMLLRVRLLWAVLALVFVGQWLVFLADIRYVLPLLPILIYGGWTLLIAAASRLPRRLGNFLFGFVVVCVVLGNLIGTGFTVVEQRSGAFYDAYRHGHYAAVREIAAAIRRESAGDEHGVVLTTQRIGPELAVWSGRPVSDRFEAQHTIEPGAYVILPLAESVRAELTRAGLAWGPPLAETRHRPTGETWTLHRLKNIEPSPQ